jgi:hypothetical protein
MLYRDAERTLLAEFNRNDFIGRFLRGERLSCRYTADELPNETSISITYPGRKTKVEEDTRGAHIHYYDYRVDINKAGQTLALSHVNILIDIFNKCLRGGVPVETMQKFLRDISRDEANYREQLDILPGRTPVPPTTALLEAVEGVYADMSRTSFDPRGNQWDLDFMELALSIKWIALQEDINYPPRRGYQGKRMSFARYQEAVLCAEGHTGHHITEVVRRALEHRRQQDWPDMDYSFLRDIG